MSSIEEAEFEDSAGSPAHNPDRGFCGSQAPRWQSARCGQDLWQSAHTEVACKRVWGIQIWGHGSLPANLGLLLRCWEWVVAPSQGVQVPQRLVHKWGQNRVWDGQAGWCSVSRSGGVVPDRLPVSLCFNNHLQKRFGDDWSTAAAPSLWMEPLEVVQASDLDASRLPLEVFWPCLNGRKARGRHRTHRRDYVYYLTWESPGIPQEELENVARERDIWTTCFTCCHHDPAPDKWMDEWMIHETYRGPNILVLRHLW